MTRSLSALAAVAALAALSGCSTSPPGEVKLGVSVAAIKVPGISDTTTTDTNSDLTIERVRVLVAHAKIGYIHEQSTGASAEIGPIVVDLTADEIKNGAHREFSLGTLPGGTYGGAEIEIEPLDAEDDQSDPAVADFVAEGASVLVDGTYKGQSFHFAGHFLAEQGTDGDVTVDASTPVALDMTVDTSAWFQDTSGVAVDPSDTTQHNALAVAMCKTLDTQPQLAPSGAPGTAPAGHGGKGGGNGGDAHCVEP
jgi:hypothetical protein